MLLSSQLLREDMDTIANINFDVDIEGSVFLVTGATGLIGSMVCRTLSYIGKKYKKNIMVLAIVRSSKKGKEILEDVIGNGNIQFIELDITEPIPSIKADYIIHTACPTSSDIFITYPVETIQSIVNGTDNILKYAKKNGCKSVVYLSSMEVYGQIQHENLLKPENIGYVNPLVLRSCYPEGKRMAENLCMGYFREYGVPVKVIRLAQTFGPGVALTDNRVFAQFIRSVKNNEDIVMFTQGGSKRMYLDTMDAISAVLTVLLRGENAQVYNVGNPSTYCSIKEMAELVIREFGNGISNLRIDCSKDIGQYPPDNMLKLDVTPIQELGWFPKYSLKEMYIRMLEGNV